MDMSGKYHLQKRSKKKLIREEAIVLDKPLMK